MLVLCTLKSSLCFEEDWFLDNILWVFIEFLVERAVSRFVHILLFLSIFKVLPFGISVRRSLGNLLRLRFWSNHIQPTQREFIVKKKFFHWTPPIVHLNRGANALETISEDLLKSTQPRLRDYDAPTGGWVFNLGTTTQDGQGQLLVNSRLLRNLHTMVSKISSQKDLLM